MERFTKIAVKDEAVRLIEAELSRFPGMETGGYLLGNAENGVMNVRFATDSGYRDAVHESSLYRMDIAYQTHICNMLHRMFTPAPEIVGLWHYHNRREDPVFSLCDRDAMAEIARMRGGDCVSILAEGQPDGTICLSVWRADENGDYEEIEDTD